MNEKVRLDHLLVQRGLAETGAKAQALILAGRVVAPGVKKIKPGEKVAPDQPLELIADMPFVSRGGEKLAGALDQFGIDVTGRAAIDIGASTGGFTDCLLQRGVTRVLALDVGHGQLHWKLQNDPRVDSREKFHVKNLTAAAVDSFVNEGKGVPPLLVVMDVSFISITKVFPVLSSVLPKDTEGVVLIKPQFEVDPKDAPKGIVRDAAVRESTAGRLRDLFPSWGLVVSETMTSPLTGRDGNVEYLFHWRKHD